MLLPFILKYIVLYNLYTYYNIITSIRTPPQLQGICQDVSD